jgi:hypothetical protein
MMTVVPFRWQGRSRIEHLRALVAARSQEWLEQWASGSPTLEVAALADAVPETRVSDRWYRLAGASGAVCARATSTTLELLGCRLAGIVTPDASGLASGVGRRALADLLKALAGSGGLMEEHAVRPEDAVLRARAGVAGLLWSLEGIRIELYLDAGLCEVLHPVPRPAATGLVARSDAILPGELALHAVLDLGGAALEDTLVLRPGEIIKTSAKLDSVVSVRSQAGDTLFSAVLVAADGHRALRCMRNSRDQGGAK